MIDLPEVMIDQPEEELAEQIEEQPGNLRTVESRERGLSEEMRRGTTATRDSKPESSDRSQPVQSPALPGLSRYKGSLWRRNKLVIGVMLRIG